MAAILHPGPGSLYARFSGRLGRLKLRAHLFHESAHGSDVTWRPLFTPGLVTLGSFLQVGKVPLHGKPLPGLRDRGLGKFPNSEKLPIRLAEEIFVEQSVVEKRAGLLPITEHHPGKSAAFGARSRNAHGVIEVLHNVVLEEPIAPLAQPAFTTHLIDLQVELSLFVRGFFHFHFSFFPMLLIVISKCRTSSLPLFASDIDGQATGKSHTIPP